MSKYDDDKPMLMFAFAVILLLMLGFFVFDKSVIVSPVESNGAIPVNIQDQTTTPVNLYITRFISNVTILANTKIDQKTVQINSVVAPTTAYQVCFKEGEHFYQGEITSVTSLGGNNYNITLASPLDYNFSVLGGCSLRSNNLAVNGAVTPVIFELSPSKLTADWHINKVVFHIEDNLAMDSSTFGGIPELPKGIVLRQKNGIIKNLLHIKNNGDFSENDAKVEYESRAPAGVYSLIATKIFNGQNNAGVTLRLNADDDDTLQVIVQDDLTGLDHMHVVAVGHLTFD